MGLWSSFKSSFSGLPAPTPRAPSMNMDAFITDRDAPVSRGMAVEMAKETMSAIDELHAKLYHLDTRQWFYDMAILYILYKAWQI